MVFHLIKDLYAPLLLALIVLKWIEANVAYHPGPNEKKFKTRILLQRLGLFLHLCLYEFQKGKHC